MISKLVFLIAACVFSVSARTQPRGETGHAYITPHYQYSSSVGVLGCKINVNRVAYWPRSVDCNNICVKVSNEGRFVYLLMIDTSGRAHDISDGGITMSYEFVHASKCKDLLNNGKLPLTAANSMNYIDSCLSQPDSWVAQNFEVYNIYDPVCKFGIDERCHVDLSISNQPDCPSGLGTMQELKMEFKDIIYKPESISATQ